MSGIKAILAAAIIISGPHKTDSAGSASSATLNTQSAADGPSYSEYRAMRAAFMQRLQEVSGPQEPNEQVVDLGNCDFISGLVPYQEHELHRNYHTLAYDAAYADFYLSRSGIDQRLWRSRLLEFERAEYLSISAS